MDTRQKVLALLQRTKAALSSIQDKAIETGDYSEVDKASALADRLIAVSQKIGNKPPAAPSGGDEPSPRTSVPSPPASDPLKDALAVDDQIAAEKTSRADRLARMDAPVQEARKANLPPVIQRNRQQLTKTVEALRAEAGDLRFQVPAPSPGASIMELRKFREALEESLPEGEGQAHNPAMPIKREALRLVDNIIRDEQAMTAFGPKPDPALLAQQKFEAMKKAGALSPEEIRRGAVGPKADDLAAPGPGSDVPDDERANELAQRQDELRTPPPPAVKLKPEQAAAAAPKVAAAYGDDQRKFLADLEETATRLRAERDREFIHRVQQELGDRPKRFTWEKLMIALTVGASAAVSAKMSSRYNGAALVDLGADQQAYDARRSQIAGQVFNAYEGRLRSEEADVRQTRQLAAMDERDQRRTLSRERIEGAKLKQREAHGKAQNAVALLNARVRERAAADMAEARRINAAGKGIANEIDGLQTQLHNIGQAFSMNSLSEQDFEAKSAMLLAQISQLAARMETLALGEAEGPAETGR